MKRFLILVLVLSFSLTMFARSPLTFEERVKAQEAIERVYYNHRIWPKENLQPKPSFEKMVSKEQIEAKVTDYLKKCSALDQFWQRPIIASQLQAEMERMAKGTKDPATLNELFTALNNDPYLIAECLARPVLADRLIHNWYANDERFHEETKAKAVDALKTLTPENFCGYSEGQYSKMKYRLEVEGREEMEDLDPEDRSIKLEEKEFAKMFAEIPEDGKISGVIEKNDCFVITHTISRNEVEIEIENLIFEKQGVEEWLKDQDVPIQVPETESGLRLYLPPTPETECTEGWRSSSLDWTSVPEPRGSFAAVWTGTEMIVWGGYYDVHLNTGARYNPATDTWVETSTGDNCPSGRQGLTAVWTGTEMIVWGGWSYPYPGDKNDGGRYNPSTDSWVATSTGENCPSARSGHTAIWTETEMIVWGGVDDKGYSNTGSRYNPSTDTWAVTSTGANCPSGRDYHTAVWTGNEMIVWGGKMFSDSTTYCLNTGGRYNPSTDTWTETSTDSNCPSARFGHTAVWTGNEMIVHGGGNTDNDALFGGRYSPATDTWVSTSYGGLKRRYHSAIWTGSEMIIWGGYWYGEVQYTLQTGGRYTPSTDTWMATSTGTNCPTARMNHCALWTGTEMLIWGPGITGGRYDPSTDSWVPTSFWDGPVGTPVPRRHHGTVWTGGEMIIWGGADASSKSLNDGGRYQPATDNWTPTSTGTNCPVGRSYCSAVWTGTEMIVWGGGYRNDGGRYDVNTDTWFPTQTAGAPPGRSYHTAVWTGAYMIVWGGESESSTYANNGSRYNPSTDTWTAVYIGPNCPSARSKHTAVWTGSEMVVWGGRTGSITYANTGGRYNPSTDAWIATSTGTNCPSARFYHTAIWTGKEMIVWGGGISSPYFNTGGRYVPGSDSWKPTSTTEDCPTARWRHTAVWTGTEMVVWGGHGLINENTGGRYNPLSDSWIQTSMGDYCPTGRADHTAAWTGGEMIVWGAALPRATNTGGIYYIPYSPSGFSSNLAGDSLGCSDSGVLVEWSSPSNWGDGSSGSRTFEILRDGTPIATGLSESTFSYTDTIGENGTPYLYQVRAVNGCGLSATTAGILAADTIGTTPDEVANFNNVFSWDPVSGAEGYRLYRGTLADLPNLMTLTADGCLRYEGTATSYDLSVDDPSSATGGLCWYLVTAYTGACEGTAGDGTGFTRLLSSTGACE